MDNQGRSYQLYQPVTAAFSGGADPNMTAAYQAAIIEQARLMQVQQAKEQLFGVPQRKPFVGEWKKKKPPKEPVDPRKYFCETCNVACGGPESFETHKSGKAHRHKEGLKSGKIQLDAFRPGYYCEICSATCSAKEAFEAHLNGSKHHRAIKTLQMLGKPIPEYLLQFQPKGDPMQNLPVQKKVVGVPATKFIGGVRLTTTHEGEMEEDPVVEEINSSGFSPIGEEFIEIVPTEGKGRNRFSFWCKICGCTIGDPTAKDLHVRGRRHRIAYKSKIDASINVEEKALSRNGVVGVPLPHQPPKTNRSILSKLNQTRPHSGFYLPPALPNTFVYDNYDEQFAHLRLEKIQPDCKFTEQVEKLVETVEHGLKKISDNLVEESKDTDSRLLCGVIRVGQLGEGLLMSFDKKVDVVLRCRDIPTLSLLTQIVADLPNQIDEEDVRSRFIVNSLPDESALVAKFSDFHVSCTVTLASTAVLRNTNDSGDADKNNSESGHPEEPPKAVVKPEDALPEKPCLRALADLRHKKFFQAQCESIHNLLEVVQLLRDVVDRIDTWNVLSLYMLELLAFKALSSCPIPLRVSDGLRRFFEMLASGTFMSGVSNKLLDPCEKEPVNVMIGLTPQQRENLVCSAQHGLRLICYDQIYTILGMDRNSLNRKRVIDEGDTEKEGGETDIKKPKTELATNPDPPASTPVFPPLGLQDPPKPQ